MQLRTVDRVMLEARAASFQTRSIKTASKLHALRLALSMLDLTTLEGKDTPEKVRALCRKAVRPGDGFLGPSPLRKQGADGHNGGSNNPPLPRGAPMDTADPLPSVAAVCVYPTFVRLAKEELAKAGGSHVKVASVATGCPIGQYP